MNLTDAKQRAIYEWLKPRLKGFEWAYGDYQGQLTAIDSMGSFFLEDLPPFDMNTAFSECIPKLNAEGVHVLFGNFGSVMWFLDKMDDDSVYESPDFYAALLQYLGVVNAIQ